MTTFQCYIRLGEGYLPFDQCECCKKYDILWDCEPEIAWPDQYLCTKCMSDGEKRKEWEDMERELSDERAELNPTYEEEYETY